ncbi:MAG: hypothetical protein DRR08_20730 [Candidatus Parabeggiatoa sp. nov. 2]|nr:MAG: hypothetical protein B6247_06915 [Beggiatoa sp. 4572_84]RKZ56798.1 MAG: hypothetical protein DRR08_20730 [Gammaproteobacteria bacterium]
MPKSGILIAQLIDYKGHFCDLSAAEHLFATVETDLTITDRHLPFLTTAKLFLDHNRTKRAAEILALMPPPTKEDDLIELAVLKKRLQKAQEKKHDRNRHTQY